MKMEMEMEMKMEMVREERTECIGKKGGGGNREKEMRGGSKLHFHSGISPYKFITNLMAFKHTKFNPKYQWTCGIQN